MTSNALVAQPTASLSEVQIFERLKTVADVLAPDAHLTPPELHLFAMVAARNGLDPFAKQIYAIRRQGKLTFQTGIDGYRSTAARTGEYDGSDEPEYGPIVTDKGVPHPEFATVTVYRRLPDGTRRAQSATAWWDEFYPGPPNDFQWKKMPRNQLAKCAEALALRKAFPYVLADVFTDAEIDQADSAAARQAEAQRIASLPTAADRLAARRQSIENPTTPAGDATEGTSGGDAPLSAAKQASEPATAPSPSGAVAGLTPEQAAVHGEVIGDTTTGLTWQQFRARMARANSTTGKVATAAAELWPDRELSRLPSEWDLPPADWAALADLLSI